jgi:Zn-dependent M28 family amino/carboxypeptidase
MKRQVNRLAMVLSALVLVAGAITGCATSEGPKDMALEAALDTIQAEELSADIQTLSSDEFEGRGPASAGETKTIEFIQAEFQKLGLQPGNGESFFQEVPLVSIAADPDTKLIVKGGTGASEFAYGPEVMAWTKRVAEKTRIADSEMVFVGYGIVAPEYEWNDYDGIDVTGKTVVILVNDPGFATQDENLFNGNTMTYYGRWTYKYEEAARQGAAAALIVHETGPAGYGWDVVDSSWSGPQIALSSADLNGDRSEIEGWLTLDSAEALFDGAGLDYQALKAAAAQPGFTAVELSDFRASVSIENSVRTSISQNVIASIPGTERPDETIIYTAHWDHLGVNPEVQGDNIYNGAADNATGTAALMALARLHSQQSPPARTLIFLAVTAEESGLLGSQWYAEHPLYPLAKTVANINMDNLNTFGRMRDVVVVGASSSELENYLEQAVSAQDRIIKAEPNPERGYYYRSDHFNFAKVGVPALYAESGEDHVEFGIEYGAAQAQDYTDNRYHAPSDEYDPDWDLSGAAEDIMMYFDIANRLARESTFPEWFEGNEFKGIRDESAAVRE